VLQTANDRTGEFDETAIRYWAFGIPMLSFGDSFGPSSSEPASNDRVQVAARKRVDTAACEEQRMQDEFHCRMVGLSSCWAQAMLRYSNCLQGRPIPPLNY
jgi:hypothetical protein